MDEIKKDKKNDKKNDKMNDKKIHRRSIHNPYLLFLILILLIKSSEAGVFKKH